MTPGEIEAAARYRYNAVGDTNWVTAEFLQMMDAAGQELARETLCIENVYTTTTVASQQEYSLPTSAISIKRITYDGQVLQKIDFREDDALTGDDASTTSTGISRYYFEFNDTIYLRPIPSDALTLKIFCYVEPQALTTSSTTLEIPSMWHMAMVDYCVAEMYAKDKDFASRDKYMARWDRHVERARRWMQRRKRGDTFATVKCEESVSS